LGQSFCRSPQHKLSRIFTQWEPSFTDTDRQDEACGRCGQRDDLQEAT